MEDERLKYQFQIFSTKFFRSGQRLLLFENEFFKLVLILKI